MIKLYLEAMKYLFLIVGILLVTFAGLTADGDTFSVAMQMLWTGIFALAGGLICQELQRLR